jgi:hypothetical protein
MRPVIVLDAETTSLTVDYGTGAGVIWELAMIERQTGAQHLWRMQPDLPKADAAALTVGRYYERTKGMLDPYIGFDSPDPFVCNLTAAPEQKRFWSHPGTLAAEVAPMLDGAVLIAANPTFDAGFLTAFLNRYGQAATWHYRLRDIGSMAFGWLAGRNTHEYAEQAGKWPAPPIDASTDDFAKALGVDPGSFERHSALGDCLLLDAMLDAMGGEA